jgi:hypothetical protein
LIEEATLSLGSSSYSQHLHLSDDGHHLYVSFDYTIYHLYMSTALDLSTATLQDDTLSTSWECSGYSGNFIGFTMNPERTTLIGVSNASGSSSSGLNLVVLVEYALSDGDLNSAVLEGCAYFEEVATDGVKRCIRMTDDETTIFNNIGDEYICKNELLTPGTITDIGTHSWGYPEGLNQGSFAFGNCTTFDFCNGSVLYTSDPSYKRIDRYELASSYDLSDTEKTDEYDVDKSILSLCLSSNGEKMFIAHEDEIRQMFVGDGDTLLINTSVFTTDSNGLIEEKPENHEATRWKITDSSGTVILDEISTTQLTTYEVSVDLLTSGHTYTVSVKYKGIYIGWDDDWSETTYVHP